MEMEYLPLDKWYEDGQKKSEACRLAIRAMKFVDSGFKYIFKDGTRGEYYWKLIGGIKDENHE